MKVHPILFLDLDGVLVDLEGKMEEMLGFNIDEISRKDFTTAYYKFINSLNDSQRYKFWTTLEPTKDYLRIWNKLEHLQPLILTAVGNCPIACEGKKKWCEKFLKIDSNRVFCSPDSASKRKYAHSNAILIDDYDRNIEQFINDGGHGIHHTNYDRTISELKKLLEKWDLDQTI